MGFSSVCGRFGGHAWVFNALDALSSFSDSDQLRDLPRSKRERSFVDLGHGPSMCLDLGGRVRSGKVTPRR